MEEFVANGLMTPVCNNPPASRCCNAIVAVSRGRVIFWTIHPRSRRPKATNSRLLFLAWSSVQRVSSFWSFAHACL
jgi:hypothetical protein